MSTTTSKWALRDLRKRSEIPYPQRQLAIVTGTVVGSLLGTIMGRPSLYAGIVTGALGYVTKIPALTSMGSGMTLSHCWELVGVGGTGLGGIKERLQALGLDMKYRLYLDKFIKPKTETETPVQGFGNVQYFRYPLNGSNLDMSALDKIQREIAQSAMNFQSNQVRGIYDDVGERLY